MKKGKYSEFPEFSNVNLQKRAKITNQRGNSTVLKSCKKYYLIKHLIERLIKSLIESLIENLIENLIERSIES